MLSRIRPYKYLCKTFRPLRSAYIRIKVLVSLLTMLLYFFLLIYIVWKLSKCCYTWLEVVVIQGKVGWLWTCIQNEVHCRFGECHVSWKIVFCFSKVWYAYIFSVLFLDQCQLVQEFCSSFWEFFFWKMLDCIQKLQI